MRGFHWSRISVVPGSNTGSAMSRPTTRWIDAPKLNSQRLTARRALDLHELRRRAITARQRAIVELQHEVAAAAFVRRDRARDVEAAVLVRGREQAARGREPHAGESRARRRPARRCGSRRRTPCRCTSVQSNVGSGTMRTVAVRLARERAAA